MLDTRERLAGHLYGSALDLDPDAAIALRIGHPDGLTWHCEDGYLTVVVGGESLPPFALNGTLQQLVSQLAVSGIEVKYANQELLHLASGALLEGAGNDQSSLADQLKVFQSNLWTVLDAYGVAVDETDRHIVEGIAQLYIGSAEGEFLDYWGEFFDVPRNADEPDLDYRTRMIVEVLRPKSNKIAIENAISEVVGDRVELYEPWRDLFYLSASKLDNERTYNGDDMSPYVFRPKYRGQNNIDWTKVLPIVEKLRPAGVMALAPEWVPDVRSIATTDHSYGIVQSSLTYLSAIYDDKARLDSYHFGDPVVNNYVITKFIVNSILNSVGIAEWSGDPAHTAASRRSFVRAQIVLSDSTPLGDTQFRFPMRVRYATNRPILGDISLSEFDPGYHDEGVEVVDERLNTSAIDVALKMPNTLWAYQGFVLGTGIISDAEFGRQVIVGESVVTAESIQLNVNSVSATPPRGWYGIWDSESWIDAGITSGIKLHVITEIR